MPKSTRKRRNSSSAAGNNNDDDDESVTSSRASSSVGSRQSSRLKRKRVSLASNNNDIIQENDDELLVELPDDKPKKRSSKRQKNKSPEDINGHDEEMNDYADNKEQEDAKLPAAEISFASPPPTNGHGNGTSNTAAAAVAVTETTANATTMPPNHDAAAVVRRATAVAEKQLRMPSEQTPTAASAAKQPEMMRRPSHNNNNHSAVARGGGLRLEPAPTPFKERPQAADVPGKEDENVEQQQQQNDEAPVEDGSTGQAADEEPQYMVALYEQACVCIRLVVDGTTDYMVGMANAVLRTTTDAVVEEEVGAEAPQEKPQPLHRTMIWFLLFLLLQIVFYPIFLNPILSTTVDGSKLALGFYKGIFSSPTPMTVETTAQELEETRRIREKVEQVNQLLEQLHKASSHREKSVEAHNDKTKELQGAVTRYEQNLLLVMNKLTNAVQHLEQTAASPKDVQLVGPTSALVDVAPLKLWEIASADCVSTTNETFLTIEDVETATEEAKAKYTELATKLIQKDDPQVKEAVRAWVQDNMLEADGKTESSSSSSVVVDRQVERVRKVIESRLNLETSADGTGRIDYAAIYNGAAVIDSSPSLLDDLPVVNRVAALLSLRFYGHGPEAALTPTYPPTALGQCWAFQKQQAGYGEFGRLTVRLAKAIYVDTISIEHPPPELTDRRNTAIRAFRVMGYEDENARGEAWSLGAFEYDIDDEDDSMRQEFTVEDEEDGEEIPALRAIRLVIDSNWGGQYACLYRFRVHGEEDDGIDSNSNEQTM